LTHVTKYIWTLKELHVKKKITFYLPPYILLHEFKVFNGPAVSNSIISQGLRYSQQYCWSYTSCGTQCCHFQD